MSRIIKPETPGSTRDVTFEDIYKEYAYTYSSSMGHNNAIEYWGHSRPLVGDTTSSVAASDFGVYFRQSTSTSIDSWCGVYDCGYGPFSKGLKVEMRSIFEVEQTGCTFFTGFNTGNWNERNLTGAHVGIAWVGATNIFLNVLRMVQILII